MVKLKVWKKKDRFNKISIQSPLYGSPLTSPLLCPQHVFQKPKERLFWHTTCKSRPRLGLDILSWIKNKAWLGARSGAGRRGSSHSDRSRWAELTPHLSSPLPLLPHLVLGSVLKWLPDSFLRAYIEQLMNPDHSFWLSLQRWHYKHSTSELDDS